LFAGAGIGLLMPSMRLWVITIASMPQRGRSVGVITSSLYLGQFLSPVLSQPIVAVHGITILYTIIGCVSLIMALFLLNTAHKITQS
jgi:MFS family permease